MYQYPLTLEFGGFLRGPNRLTVVDRWGATVLRAVRRRSLAWPSVIDVVAPAGERLVWRISASGREVLSGRYAVTDAFESVLGTLVREAMDSLASGAAVYAILDPAGRAIGSVAEKHGGFTFWPPRALATSGFSTYTLTFGGRIALRLEESGRVPRQRFTLTAGEITDAEERLGLPIALAVAFRERR